MDSPAAELQELLREAKRHLARAELHEAITRTTEAIRLDGENSTAYLLRADAHRRLKKLERALADLAVAIRLDAQQPGPYVIRAEILKRRNMFDQAIADATHALIVDPRNAAAFSVRAQCRHAIGDREGADEDVQDMLLIDPTRPVPDLRPRAAAGSDPTAMASDDERFWKQSGEHGKEDERALFADGKPVDRTYRSYFVSDEDAPEALGTASGYKPETISRPIPRYHANRKRSSAKPLVLGMLGLAIVGGGFHLVNLNRNPQAMSDPPRTAPAEETTKTPRTDGPALVSADTQRSDPSASVVVPIVDLPKPLLALTFDEDGPDDKSKIWENRGAVLVEGKVGRAVEFDGSTYLRVSGSYPAATAPRTIAVWLKSNRGPVDHNVHILAYGPHEPNRTFGIMEAAGQWRFFDWGGGLPTSISVDPSWHHHAVTHDGKSIRYYFDGRLVGEVGRSLTTVGEPLVLGVSAPGDTNGFVGRIDELSIYDIALNESQIEAHRESGLAGRHARPLADRTSTATGGPPPIEHPAIPAHAANSIDPSAEILSSSGPGPVHLVELPRTGLVEQNGWWSDRGELVLGGLSGNPVGRKPLTFNGQHSVHGIYLHARPSGEASITYRLGGRFATFRSEALIPEMFPHQGDPRTPLVLEVRGDGRTLWRSRPLARKGDHQPCSISVRGIDELSLRVECRGPENWGLAAWVEPRLIRGR